MGGQQSKEELLYQQVNAGNIAGIKALREKGAALEWMDSEGRTPLILTCTRPDLWHITELLIQMGANVNAYRPGSHAGTPLHHAAKRGLEHTVNLLLSHGANPVVMNDDCHTTIDLARMKGFCNIVRAIESCTSLYSGFLWEAYGPSFLEALAPRWMTRKIWAVVLPSGSRNPSSPAKFDLAIYPDLWAAQPQTTIALWKVHIEEPKFNQPDPAVLITDKATKARYKFLAGKEDNQQQLLWFYNACRGIQQVNIPVPAPTISAPVPIHSLPANPGQEDMAIIASIQTAIAEGGASSVPPTSSADVANGWGSSSTNPTHNGWGPPPPDHTSQLPQTNPAAPTAVPPLPAQEPMPAPSVPSAPPILDDELISYPSVDFSPLSLPALDPRPWAGKAKEEDINGGNVAGWCVICLDAQVAGACIPCGHMAGCMPCLNEIKTTKGVCPVCRAQISQVVKIYAV